MMKFLRTQMKWIMAVIVVAFLLSTFLMYEGRSTRRSPGPRNADGSMEDYEVAKINGRSLMRSELEQRVRNYLNSYSTRSAISLDIAAIYQSVLDQAILDSQRTKEIQEKGITVTEDEADKAMKLYADTYYPTREAFYQVLNNSGIKVEDYKRGLAFQMANDRLTAQAVGEIVVSEDRAVEFYDTMKSLIYTKPEGSMLQVANFHSEQAAKDMLAKINAGQDWVAIASGDNDFASKDVANITKEPVFLPLSAMRSGTLSVLASLDVGQISPIFNPVSGDFAVALVTEHVDESITPYDEVSADIRTMLRNQEERKRINDYNAELMSKAEVVVNDKSLFERPVVSEDKKPEEISEVEAESEVPEVSSDSEAKSESEPEAKTESKSESEVKTDSETKSESKPETEAKSESEAKAESETKSETEAQEVPEVKEVEAVKESEDVKEVKPEAAAKSESEAKAQVTEVKEVKEVEPEVKAESESKSEDVKETPAAQITEVPEVKEIPEVKEVTEVTPESAEPEKVIEVQEVKEPEAKPESESKSEDVKEIPVTQITQTVPESSEPVKPAEDVKDVQEVHEVKEEPEEPAELISPDIKESSSSSSLSLSSGDKK